MSIHGTSCSLDQDVLFSFSNRLELVIPGQVAVPVSSPRVRFRRGPVYFGFIAVVVAFVFLLGWYLRRRENPEVLRRSAQLAAQAGQWKKADDILIRFDESTPSDWLLRALVAVSLDQFDAAERALARIDPDGPQAVPIALLTGRLELGRHRARRMEQALVRALRLDPKLAEARRLLIYLYGIQSRRGELIEQFAALAEDAPLTLDLVSHWCMAHNEQIKEAEDQVSDLEPFLETDPEDRWSRLGLCSALRKLGLLDRAEAVVAPLPDSDSEARACRVEIEFVRGDLDAIERLLAAHSEENVKLARLRGRLALARSDATTAIRSFRIAEASDPNHPETVYGLAKALRIAGNRLEAEKYERRAEAQRLLSDVLGKPIESNVSRPTYCSRMAKACETAGYRAEARAWYGLAVSFDPFDRQAQEAIYRLKPHLKD